MTGEGDAGRDPRRQKRRSRPKKARASWTLEQVVDYFAWLEQETREARARAPRPTPKDGRARCGALCRDGSGCDAPPAWDRDLNRPINGRCRMHGGLSTGPRTEEGRGRIAESNRNRAADAHKGSKRGKRSEVTQRGDTP